MDAVVHFGARERTAAEGVFAGLRCVKTVGYTGHLRKRAERHLEVRGNAFIKNWFMMSGMPRPEEDAKLLDLAGEVARESGREKK